MVTLFSTGPGCHKCMVTKMHLKRRGIEFEEVRLDQNEALAELVRGLGFVTAPVLLIGDEDVIEGYSPDAIDALAAELVAA